MDLLLDEDPSISQHFVEIILHLELAMCDLLRHPLGEEGLPVGLVEDVNRLYELATIDLVADISDKRAEHFPEGLVGAVSEGKYHV